MCIIVVNTVLQHPVASKKAKDDPIMKTQSLNGSWLLSGKNAAGLPATVPATVPGYVHPALEAAGVIEPYFWRDNAEKCQWIEDVEWSFSRTFFIEEATDISRARLRGGGLLS